MLKKNEVMAQRLEKLVQQNLLIIQQYMKMTLSTHLSSTPSVLQLNQWFDGCKYF